MPNAIQKWAFLADPDAYGWTELVRDGTAVWDGIANARAQNHLRTTRPGDLALIYHTAPDKAIVGIARVTAEPRPDPNAEGRVVVDVEPVKPLARKLGLAELKADDVLRDMSFVRMPRVAVQRVSDEEWALVLKLSGTRLKE
jgi:predicted RNA-binding protein with PUA-like domain